MSRVGGALRTDLTRRYVRARARFLVRLRDAVGFVPLAISGSLKPGEYTGALELEQELFQAVEDADDEHARQVVARMEAAACEASAKPGRGPKTAAGGVDLSAVAATRQPASPNVALAETRAALGWIAIFLLPALVELLAAAVLIFLSLKALYLANDTFGADVLLDDVGLIVWTLGATIAGKILGGLTPAR